MKARKPLVKINSWGGETRIAETVTLAIHCGSYPSLTVTHHKNTDVSKGAQKVTAAELFEALGKQQQEAFKGAGEPNVDVSIDCGDGEGETKFSGISCGDTYGFSTSAVNIQGNALPAWALMDMLDYSIYKDANGFVLASDTNETDPKEKETILEVLKDVENTLIQSWDRIETALQDAVNDNRIFPSELESARVTHERNMRIRQYFIQLLDASKDTFGWFSIDKLMQEDVAAKKEINANIREAAITHLTSNVGNFMSAIAAMAGQFQCLYVPELDNPGKFVNMAYLVASEAQELEIDCLAGCSMSASNPDGILPIGHVHVYCPKTTDSNMSTQFRGVSVPKATRALGGATMSVNIPDWCNTTGMAVDFRNMVVEEYADGETTDASVEQVDVDLSETAEEDAQAKLVIGNVATAWGLCAYAWSALVNCHASLNVPATLKYTVGKRYKVKSGDSVLFEGFLNGCSTVISAENCLTTLEFSHIMAPGFELPGTDEMKENGLVY